MEVDNSPPRVLRSNPSHHSAKPANQWSKNESKQLRETIDWCVKFKVFLEKQQSSGSHSNEDYPKPPENEFTRKIFANKMKNTTKKSKTSGKKQLRGAELSRYLRTFYDQNPTVEEINVNELGINLKDIAESLKKAYKLTEYKTLKSYFELGGLMCIAKARFNELKILTKLQDTWAEWVDKNTGMSAIYCRRVRQLYKLLYKFPKLQCLKGISFNEMCKRHSSIQSAFKDPTIASEWL